MKRQFLSAILTLLTLSTVKAQNTDLTLSSYSGQSQIKARGSVTLKPGVHIPSGSTVRIYTSSTLPEHPVLQTQPNANQNYILMRTFRRAGITSSNLSQSRTADEENQTVQYFDGLGRLNQTVEVMGSPTHKDIVQHVEYDNYGREVRKYLPYVSSGNADGSYKATAATEVIKYYAPATGWDPAVKKTAFPYAETQFENSPLNRVQAQGSPGEAWQLNTGHTVRTDYGTNETNDVRMWEINPAENGASSTFYPSGRLYRTVVKDENQTSGKSGTVEEYKDFDGRVVLKRVWETETKKLETYYIYDDFGDLRYVVPPAVTAGNFTEADQSFSNSIYAYKYDGRRRLTEKKIPGKEKEAIVYNQNDQPILTQDGEQTGKEWAYTKYDAFGRVTETGTYPTTADRSNLQSIADQETAGSLWESRGYNASGYSNVSFPRSNTRPEVINYYDDYGFAGSTSLPESGISRSSLVHSLQTGSLVYTTEGTQPLLTVLYYDDYGRVIQTASQNHLSGTDYVTNTYSFPGELLVSTRKHTAGGQTTTIVSTYEYDHTGRLIASRQRINAQQEVTLSLNSYNETGQLKEKAVGANADANNPVNTTTYAYNERGWMTSRVSGQFSQHLRYQDPVNGAPPQWNGNISEQQWGQSTILNQHFVYSYDALNRLKSGSSPTSGMSEQMNYDDMGNITNLTRDGGMISYSYTGNRLNAVSGSASGSYSYDANGNAKTDRTGMSFVYNRLNLPRQVTGGGRTVGYLYDALGTKLRKTANTTGQRDYIDGIEYQNGTIELIHTAEGVAYRNTNGVYTYQYHLTDHLGNVRATVYRNPNTNAIEVLQRDDYYPFGLQKSPGPVYGNNKYLYNGKEKQEELGGQLDYGARFYDPVIGRWNVPDPLGEVHYSQTGYHYVLNSPLAFSDPLGLDTIPVNNFRIKDYEEDVDVVALSGATVTRNRSSNNGFATLSFLDASDDPYFKKRPYDVIEYRRTLNAARDPAIDLMNVASIASGIGDAYLLTRGGIMILKGGIPLILKRLALKKALKEGLTNAQLVQKAATKAEAAIGGIGRFAGTAKHKYATNLLERYQRIYGNRGLFTNFSFNNGVGNRGTLDVLDKINGIVYDFKFGKAVMSSSQYNKYLRNFGLPIQIVRP
ncbi:DUF6443 domain-containing protein [Sphingobacterium spiritivorum]|uniref:DUF6443 domain-containing protein n=1 Tax=Sphingobacterium spiritivorum TaxID=258 RepID=UPI00191A8BD1|nr:DUF6443 domain-containing protein [Sphingobacterium spiritivorum]QQT26037.1 RHS repeat-associated core domain-containing protein [Sphingobacterium spiritivorum]